MCLCVFSYQGPVCLFSVFGVFSVVCFELSVSVQVIAWKDLISEVTHYVSSGT